MRSFLSSHLKLEAEETGQKKRAIVLEFLRCVCVEARSEKKKIKQLQQLGGKSLFFPQPRVEVVVRSVDAAEAEVKPSTPSNVLVVHVKSNLCFLYVNVDRCVVMQQV